MMEESVTPSEAFEPAAVPTTTLHDGAYPWILEHVLTYPSSYEIPLRTMYTLNSTPAPAKTLSTPLASGSARHSHGIGQRSPSVASARSNSDQSTHSQSLDFHSDLDHSDRASRKHSQSHSSHTSQYPAADHFRQCLMEHISHLPTQPFSLPPAFITSFVRRCFTEELCLVDFTQALTALDYLKDLETRRRRELSAALQRLRLDHPSSSVLIPTTSEESQNAGGQQVSRSSANQANVINHSDSVMKWLADMQVKDRKAETLYTNLYVGLRKWTLINEMRLEPFSKASCLAMLNTLYPPNPSTSTAPTRQLTPAILSRHRDSYFHHILAVEGNGKEILHAIEQDGRRPEDDNGWSVVRNVVDGYLRHANRMIDDCLEVEELDSGACDTVAALQHIGQSRHDRDRDRDRHDSASDSNGNSTSNCNGIASKRISSLHAPRSTSDRQSGSQQQHHNHKQHMGDRPSTSNAHGESKNGSYSYSLHGPLDKPLPASPASPARLTLTKTKRKPQSPAPLPIPIPSLSPSSILPLSSSGHLRKASNAGMSSASSTSTSTSTFTSTSSNSNSALSDTSTSISTSTSKSGSISLTDPLQLSDEIQGKSFTGAGTVAGPVAPGGDSNPSPFININSNSTTTTSPRKLSTGLARIGREFRALRHRNDVREIPPPMPLPMASPYETSNDMVNGSVSLSVPVAVADQSRPRDCTSSMSTSTRVPPRPLDFDVDQKDHSTQAAMASIHPAQKEASAPTSNAGLAVGSASTSGSGSSSSMLRGLRKMKSTSSLGRNRRTHNGSGSSTDHEPLPLLSPTPSTLPNKANLVRN